jgi:UDP-glucose 4-epimerase
VLIDLSKRYAVTGGAGFIGSNLAERLADGNDVVIIDDLSRGYSKNIDGIDAKFIKGSITDLDLLKDAFADVDCVFHLAAIASVQSSVENPLETNCVGIDGTLNVLMASRYAGVKKVVFSSSAAVYGQSPQLPKREDMRPDPKSPYAVSKIAGEYYCKVFEELYGLRSTVLRYFNVYGPKQDPSSEYSGVISRFVFNILKGETPVIYGDGEQTRDFVYVMDVVKANILASRSDLSGVFNIAGGKSISLNQLAELIGRALGRDVVPKHIGSRPGDIRDSLADISRAKQIGYAPGYTMEEGLADCIHYFEENLG